MYLLKIFRDTKKKSSYQERQEYPGVLLLYEDIRKGGGTEFLICFEVWAKLDQQWFMCVYVCHWEYILSQLTNS